MIMLQQYKKKQVLLYFASEDTAELHVIFFRTTKSDFETNIPAGGSLVLVMTNSGSLQHWDSSFQTASLFIFSRLL